MEGRVRSLNLRSADVRDKAGAGSPVAAGPEERVEYPRHLFTVRTSFTPTASAPPNMQDDPTFDAPDDWNALWLLVGEGLLGGVHHALNNRVAALSAISQVLGIGIPDTAPLMASLETEVDRLEQAVTLISLLRRARSGRPEPIQLPELAATLPPLLLQHADLKETRFEVPGDAGLMPAWAERDLLTRVLLTLMVAAGLESERGGGGGVRLEYGVTEGVVTVGVAVMPGGGGAAGRQAPRGLHAGAAAEAAREMGGELLLAAGEGVPSAYTLRLPSLLTVDSDAPG